MYLNNLYSRLVLYWTYPHYCRDIDILERAQRRATKLIPTIFTLSYESRLNHLQLHSLYCRQQRSDLIKAYKIIDNYYHIKPDSIFTKLLGSTTRGHTLKFFKPRVNTTIRQHFFNIRVINHWNNLPQDIASAKSISSFKSKLEINWIWAQSKANGLSIVILFVN